MSSSRQLNRKLNITISKKSEFQQEPCIYPFRGSAQANVSWLRLRSQSGRENSFFRQPITSTNVTPRPAERSSAPTSLLLHNTFNYQASEEETTRQQHWFNTGSSNFVLGLERMAEQIEEDTARGIVYPRKK